MITYVGEIVKIYGKSVELFMETSEGYEAIHEGIKKNMKQFMETSEG